MANEQFYIKDIINKQAQGLPLEEQTQSVNNDTELVRYKGGETVKDRNGEEYKKQIPSVIPAPIPTGPLKAKKGEPEYGHEWAEDAAQKIWDSGRSMDDVESEMNKKWPLASTIIKDNEKVAQDAEASGSNEYVQYYDKREAIDTPTGEKYTQYINPREQAEAVLAGRYGFYSTGNPAELKGPIRPSVAIGLLHKSNLKKDWEDFINLNGVESPSDFARVYTTLRGKLQGLTGTKSEKELKKLGFTSQEDYNMATRYLIKSFEEKANSMAVAFIGKGSNTPKSESPAVNPPLAKTENVKAETKAEVNTSDKVETAPSKAKVDIDTDDTENNITDTETDTEVDTEVNTDANEDSNGDYSYALEEARLESETNEQEKKAQEEAEAIAKKELTRKEAEDLEKKLEEAAKKKQQDLFDYEDWLKNPTIISGIFGRSGLSTARRVGLGLATLFAIFSDVAANYGKGINNNTDFKTAAMDQLNSTIAKIQDKRAEAIGGMAAKPYSTTTENEEKLNKDYEKLRRLPAGTYIPKNTLQAFIQESQIDTKEPMSESLYNRFMNESREGFIDSIKRNKSLRNAYLDEDGNLNADGESKFLEKQGNAIAQYKNVLGLSDERLSNINGLLEMDKKRAEVRAKVHDVIFQTNADYINSINAMEAENRALEESKLGFTEAKTLDAMLDLAQKNRSVISGLATSSASTTEGTSDTESSLNRFSEQGGIEKVNEELKKHGWQAELNGEVGAKFPLKVVPITGEISAGGKWTSEQANKHLQTEYEKWTRDDQRSLSKARNLSAASGRNIDETFDEVMNWLNSEKAKGAEAVFNKVRKNVLDAIDNKIQFNNQIIDELKDMREKERKFDTGENSSASTRNPYADVAMFDDVPTKNADWYRHRLALS